LHGVFDCVPEENTAAWLGATKTRDTRDGRWSFNIPRRLLGDAVHALFGTGVFPILFYFLDTMEGGNLSFPVAKSALPSSYRPFFGMHSRRTKIYYLLDVGKEACVYRD